MPNSEVQNLFKWMSQSAIFLGAGLPRCVARRRIRAVIYEVLSPYNMIQSGWQQNTLTT